MTDAIARVDEYLLGGLSDEDRSAFEREYFADAATFERVLQAETDLIDRYVRGRLTADERRRFERVYLRDPRRLERVRFAEALAAEVDRLESTRSPRPSLRLVPTLAIAASLLLAVAAGALWFRNTSLRREMATVEGARAAAEQQLAAERARSETLQRDLNRAATAPNNTEPTTRPTPAGPLVVALLLHAGAERNAPSGRAGSVSLPPTATAVRLELETERLDYRGYQLSVRRVGGTDIYADRDARPRALSVGERFVFTAMLPVERLPPGDYMVTLRGQTPDGDVDDISRLLFRVERLAAGASR